MEPKRFRKKPVEIEAMVWDGTAEAATPIIQWVEDNGGSTQYWCLTDSCSGDSSGHVVVIETLEGKMQAQAGDVIIKGVQGEFYPCKPDIFEQTYDRIAHVIELSTYGQRDPEYIEVE